MFHHVGLRSDRPEVLIAFYEAVLEPLGYAKLASYEGGAGFGAGDGASFWIRGASLWIAKSTTNSSVHIAFACRERAAVDAFFQAALRAGGKDNGSPGIRKDYHSGYYAAFVTDPDGNNVEAVCLTE